MKRCSKCGEKRPEGAFGRNVAMKSGLQSFCKECARKKAAAWRKAHPEYGPAYHRSHAEATNARHAETASRNRSRAMKEWGGKCSRCGKYKKRPWLLEFHHNDPIHETGARRVNFGWKWLRIFTALCGCILVCANCHKTIHYNLKKGIPI